ncbi:SH2 domain-containing protein 4B-like isoform X1 [Babylonia areolata]|uniref:SH2 domain-containing protein 4B-like isoform X1 n=1 Tax=Babylonia areolata TaxID=304850 RepID=UPI003FD290A9
MLQQILKDLYVDPEILAELDEDQKQVLFVKMREEQVRRWNEREEEFEKELRNNPKPSQKPGSKKVDFLQGADGCEWVWVMGEHKNDLTIEEILEKEAQQEAQQQAEQETLALKEKEEQELKEKIEAEKLRMKQETERLEKEMKQTEELSKSSTKAKDELAKIAQLRHQYEQREQQRLKELSDEQKRLRRRSMEVMETEKNRRSKEIYVKWKTHRVELEKQVEEGSKEVEESWKMNEDKAKEAEEEMRNVARRARIEYKESLRRASQVIQTAKAFSSPAASSQNKPPIPPKRVNNQASVKGSKGKPRPLRPRNRAMVIDWFVKEEKEKGSGLDPDTGKVAEWFHGVINRTEAEKLLAEKGTGAFLVRVSERVWGYTISYQEQNRCKHFLIDTTDEGYQFIGIDQLVHKSLAELITFHVETPITISGQEKLSKPVGQTTDPPDYWELFQGNKTEFTAL